MQCTVTYVHHNCFLLKTSSRTWLFDYPEDKFLPPGAAALVRRAVAGDDLAVFVSHGHEDHLNGNLASVVGTAAEACLVLSDDIPELRPEAVPGGYETLVVEPDERYEFRSMRIETLMSNDLGVAFLVQDGEFRFYFGGDLACWIWEGASPREAEFTRRFFTEAMERVRDFGPQVAFCNVDRRLANLAGGVDACRIIAPPLFVPMHSFGVGSWPESLSAECGSDLFLYRESGDALEYHF
jgi:L-ascorbate metabolism protein UlaG (beta-lactamase superfamily)